MAAHQFRGIPFENPIGENLCFCNAAINALLSSEHITSRIRQWHCTYCNFLYGMKNLGPSPLTKSARPLKVFVAQSKPNFRGNRQQDVDEFILCLLECEILRELTKSEVLVTHKCKRCGEISHKVDERNILYENLEGNSITEIMSSTEKTFPTLLNYCVLIIFSVIQYTMTKW